MAPKFQDYYETLGVARTATAEELKLAFRRHARLHHPDVARDKIAGEAKFKELNEAYEVLSDPAKRKRYDALGAHGPDAGSDHDVPRSHRPRRSAAGPPDFEFNGTGFSDFFESYFAGADAGFTHAGPDVEADLLVTLDEALHGATRQITLRRPGRGDAAERNDTYQVGIPAGVREGKRIRLAGQGGTGPGGATAGDLYLRVRLARHPDFTVDGADLHCDLALAPWEAVLGVQATIPTLDGRMSLRVPPGTGCDCARSDCAGTTAPAATFTPPPGCAPRIPFRSRNRNSGASWRGSPPSNRERNHDLPLPVFSAVPESIPPRTEHHRLTVTRNGHAATAAVRPCPARSWT